MGNLFSYYFCSTLAKESKVILVTGASAGIGKESALALLRRGHTVYGAARRLDKMQDIVKAGGYAIAMDITKDEDCVSAVKRVIAEQGRIDVLVNNAGYSELGPIEYVPMEAARRQFDVNLFGLAFLTKQVLPFMHKAGKGTIVNMSSGRGRLYSPLEGWYGASKHALEGWSDALRLELHPFNIRVAIIEPGMTKTETFDVCFPALMARSSGTRYEAVAAKVDATVERMKGMASAPCVIADLVVHASESKNPKRRYVGGFGAKPFLFLRDWFNDAVNDFVWLQLLKG